MTDEVKKVLIQTIGAVVICLIVALAIYKYLIPPPPSPFGDYYQERDCGNGKKVYQILTDEFNTKYDGRKIGLNAELKDKLKASIGVEDIALQKADQSVQTLRTSISGLLKAYNADPCSEKGADRLDKLADYIVNYSVLSANVAQLQALAQSGTKDDLNKAKALLADQNKIANATAQRLMEK
jgi:hypothetical protein